MKDKQNPLGDKKKEIEKKIVGATIASFVVGIAVGSIAQYILNRQLKEYAKKRKSQGKKK